MLLLFSRNLQIFSLKSLWLSTSPEPCIGEQKHKSAKSVPTVLAKGTTLDKVKTYKVNNESDKDPRWSLSLSEGGGESTIDVCQSQTSVRRFTKIVSVKAASSLGPFYKGIKTTVHANGKIKEKFKCQPFSSCHVLIKDLRLVPTSDFRGRHSKK